MVRGKMDKRVQATEKSCVWTPKNFIVRLEEKVSLLQAEQTCNERNAKNVGGTYKIRNTKKMQAKKTISDEKSHAKIKEKIYTKKQTTRR
jgi:hypothetical protein